LRHAWYIITIYTEGEIILVIEKCILQYTQNEKLQLRHVFNSTHKPRNGGCDMHVTIYTKPEMVIGTHVLMLRRVQQIVIWSDVYCYTQQRKW
jgi:hypothetical protein